MFDRVPRSLFAVAGLLLLADSVSQLRQAIPTWEPLLAGWRVAQLRLVFTQVTPLMIAAVLIGIGTVRSAAGLARAGLAGLGLAVVILLLALMLGIEGTALAGSLDGPALGLHKRGLAQALLSGSGAVLGLAAIGWFLLRRSRQASLPLPPAVAS